MKDNLKIGNTEEVLQPLKENISVANLSEMRSNPFYKLFKSLGLEGRIQLMGSFSEVMLERFSQKKPFSDLTLLIVAVVSMEPDWESSLELLKKISQEAKSIDFLKDFAINLVDIADHEINSKNHKIPLAQCALVLLTEFGLHIADSSGKNTLPPKELSHIVEFITTSLLARSNINHSAVRVALVHYLASFPISHKSSLQLNRVISRFGQTLLDELLRAFFEDKRKGNAAFFYLVEHLNCFFSSSPALAEMSHGTLKHYMFKYSEDFHLFLESYVECMKKSLEVSMNATKHITLLALASTALSQSTLTSQIGQIIFNHIKGTRNVSVEIFQQHIMLFKNIIGKNEHPNIAPIIKSMDILEQSELKSLKDTENVVYLAKIPKKTKSSKNTNHRISEKSHKPSPLETMLQLAV
jgi:hypothetical protein